MIQITDRDKKIKQFLEVVQIADTKTIHSIYFKNTTIRNCQKRLKQLVDIRFLKVYRENIISQNLYYSKYKPKNIPHKIKFSQLLGELYEQNIEVHNCYDINPMYIRKSQAEEQYEEKQKRLKDGK